MNSDFAPIDRRGALTALTALGAAAATGSAFAQPRDNPPPIMVKPGSAKPPLTPLQLGWDAAKGEYTLPELPYAHNALEPHIDAKTMEIHHGKHHAAYVTGLNKAVRELRNIREGGDAGLVKHWSRELSFHGSGHMNHTLFWLSMAPPAKSGGKGGGGQPSGTLAAAIDQSFGSFSAFAAHFKAAAQQVEGGGWAWLVYEPVARQLLIIQEEKQQDMMLTGARPLLGIDVWEHAYYLKHQNNRSAYIDSFMNVANWSFVQSLFDNAIA